MSDKRSSVMVLPVVGGKVLLQWFKNNGQTIWDGFGSFYLNGNDSKVTAQKVFADTFKESISPENLVERAKLNMLLNISLLFEVPGKVIVLLKSLLRSAMF